MLFSQIASFLLYLSDVEEGGETMFPFEVNSQLKSSLLCSFFSVHTCTLISNVHGHIIDVICRMD